MSLPPPAGRWLGVFVAVCAVDLAAELTHASWLGLVASALAMPTLLIFFRLVHRRPDRLRRLVTLALAFSWLGDVAGFTILVKIIFFFVAHVGYSAAFWPVTARRMRRRRLVLATYAVVVVGIIVVVAPHAGALAPAVIAYGLALGSMAVLATGLHRLSAIGAALFVLSDTVIAVTTFVVPGRFALAGFVIMVSYLPAQLLIILGVLRAAALRSPAAAGDAAISALYR